MRFVCVMMLMSWCDVLMIGIWWWFECVNSGMSVVIGMVFGIDVMLCVIMDVMFVGWLLNDCGNCVDNCCYSGVGWCN